MRGIQRIIVSVVFVGVLGFINAYGKDKIWLEKNPISEIYSHKDEDKIAYFCVNNVMYVAIPFGGSTILIDNAESGSYMTCESFEKKYLKK